MTSDIQGIIWGEPDLAVTRRDFKLEHYFAEAWHRFDSNGVKAYASSRRMLCPASAVA